MSKYASPLPWLQLCTTVHGRRRTLPYVNRRTKPYGDRSSSQRESGQDSSCSLDHFRGTALCGAPQGTPADPRPALSGGVGGHSAALSFLLLRALMEKKEEQAEEGQRKARKLKAKAAKAAADVAPRQGLSR